MKVVLVHDYLTRFGGAERVLAALAEIWPEAPVFTSVVAGKTRPFRKDGSFPKVSRPKTSVLQRFPKTLRTSKLVVPFYSLIFENLDLSGFDVIISSGYFSKGVLTTPEQLHINYCHTVPRFLYGYPTETRIRQSLWGKIVTAPVDHKLRIWDFYSAQRPDFIVANSKTVAARIKKFWRCDSTVIYPPVEAARQRDSGTAGQLSSSRRADYFLVVSRLEPYKNVDLAVRACNELELSLKVVGEGSEERRLRRLAGPTVEVLGRVSEAGLAALYSGCRALIATAQDEDFGIAPVEAMAYGKPVIALRSGGVIETVVEGKTGLFFNGPTVDSLKQNLQRFETFFYRPEDCLAQARKFSKERFKREFREFVEEHYEALHQANSR